MPRRVLSLALFLALAVLSLRDSLAESSPRTIRFGYYDARPSCYRDASGRPSGIFIDIIEAVAKREGWRIDFEFATWDQLLDKLRSGAVELVPAIVDTPERSSYAAFTAESVMSDWGVVFARPGRNLSSILDLDRKQVGALENDFWYSGPGSLKELCASFGLHPIYRFFSDYPTLFRALGRGEIDAAVGSNSLGVVRTPNVPVVATSIVYNPVALRFAASRAAPGGIGLARELDLALASIRRDYPEVFTEALAKYQIPLRREARVPSWLILLLTATSIVLVVVILLLRGRQRELGASEGRLRSFFEDSPISIWEEDFSALKRGIDAARAAGETDWAAYFEPSERMAQYASLVKVLDVNRAALKLLGYERKTEVLASLSKFFGEAGLDTLRLEFVALASGQRSFEGESVHLDARGNPVTVQFRLSIMPGYEKSWARVLVSLVDLSERIRAERALMQSLAEKELLLREVHHRVKNNLQIICSLISLQLHEGDTSTPTSRSLVDMEARVRAMSLVHEILYQSDSFASVAFSSYVGHLCDHLLESYGVDSRRVRLELSVEDLRLPLEKAIPCGLLINELVVNALKHAFPGDRRGTVLVQMHRVHEDQVTLIVSDDGVGASQTLLDEGRRRSIGMSLIRSLAGQLSGDCRIEGLQGVRVQVDFPV